MNNKVKAFTAFDMRSNQFCDAITNASMLCLYAGTGSDKQKNYTIKHCERILDNCVYGMPSVDPKHKKFESERYWRGPVWINCNWIIYQGLKNKNIKFAKQIKRKTINLVKQKGFNEYFSCKTGKGFGATNFSWTAALFLDLILENKND